MAAPNIVNVTTITANAAYMVANNAAISGVLTNSSGSNSVIKVNSVLVTNYGANSITANVDVLRGASSFLLAGGVSVPGNSTLVALAKDIILYLVEGDTLRENVSYNTAIVSVSYETIS